MSLFVAPYGLGGTSPVRGNSGLAWPDPRFANHADGTVTDNLTGLMWTQQINQLAPYGMAWQDALDHVARINAGLAANYGYTDWRLPNIQNWEV